MNGSDRVNSSSLTVTRHCNCCFILILFIIEVREIIGPALALSNPLHTATHYANVRNVVLFGNERCLMAVIVTLTGKLPSLIKI